MYCTNCGAEIEDDSKFCTNCGCKIDGADEIGSNAEEPKKMKIFGKKMMFGEKKPFGGKKIIIAAGVVAAAALVIGVPNVIGFVCATILSPKSYYQYIEKKEAEKLADVVSSYYGEYVLNMIDGASGGEGTVTLEIGEDLQDLVSLAGVDVSWLNNASIGVSGASNDKAVQGGLALGINGTDLANLNVVVDTEEMEVYFQIPELSKTYMGASLGNLDIRQGKQVLETVDELKAVLPSEKEVHDLVEKYAKIAVKNIDTVKRDKTQLKAGGVSQNCTVLKVTLDEETIEAIMEDILREIPKDKQLENVLKKVLPFYQKSITYYGAREQDAEELYDIFIEEIERLQDEVDINLYGTKIISKVYADGKSAVRGRTITVNDDSLTYAMPRKGSKFGLCLEVNGGRDTISFTGAGKCSGEVLNGDFTLNYFRQNPFSTNSLSFEQNDDMDLLDVKLEKFDLAALKKGYPNGTMTFKLAKETLNQIGGLGNVGVDNLTKNLLKKYALVFDLKMAEKKMNAKVAIKDEKETLCVLGYELKRNNASNAAVPSSDKVIFVEGVVDFSDWLQTVEFEGIMEKLENKIQVPSEYLDVLKRGLMYAGYVIH